jgi:hypothetical protein
MTISILILPSYRLGDEYHTVFGSYHHHNLVRRWYWYVLIWLQVRSAVNIVAQPIIAIERLAIVTGAKEGPSLLYYRYVYHTDTVVLN